jgi:D-alanyl-D-alanine carboxypeptidase
MPEKIKKRWFQVTLILILSVGIFLLWQGRAGAPRWTFLNNQPAEESAPSVPSFNKQLHSIDEPSSLWFIVNKQRALPAGYAPAGLRQPAIRLRASGSSEMLLRDETATAVEQMTAAAAKQGINLMLVSGYRSYGLQQSVYSGNVAREGQAGADLTSARPGHSEHQTGLAADLGSTNRFCELETCFGQTPEGRWLATHAHEFGFVVRYPDNKQAIVGYTYEPWHMRYVGPELAGEIAKTGQTLEEFFGLPPAPTY